MDRSGEIEWCAAGVDAASCAGQPLTAEGYCLVHGDPEYLERCLRSAASGMAISFLTGVLIDADLLAMLFTALDRNANGGPILHNPNFVGATFADEVDMRNATIQGDSMWQGARFVRPAGFRAVRFDGTPNFGGTLFEDEVTFQGSHLVEGAEFVGAVFGKGANFSDTVSGDQLRFAGARFLGAAIFDRTSNYENVRLDWAYFLGDPQPAEVLRYSPHLIRPMPH